MYVRQKTLLTKTCAEVHVGSQIQSQYIQKLVLLSNRVNNLWMKFLEELGLKCI
jgi:hypothetical protein